jgi:hypothetical protein
MAERSTENTTAGNAVMEDTNQLLVVARGDARFCVGIRDVSEVGRIVHLACINGPDKTFLGSMVLHGWSVPVIDVAPAIGVAAAKRADGDWILGVQDEGIGIAPESAEKIFAPFKRLHRDDEYEGIGVGLTCCRKIIDMYGGRIWVESQPGQGATFYFALAGVPVPDEAKPQTEAVHALS